MRDKLEWIYNKLFLCFGSQHWWPAKTTFEVIVGAILTQNTSWLNVGKAIKNLKKNKLLDPRKLHRLPSRKLGRLIRSAGYYNIKAKRLKEFLNFLFIGYNGSLKKMRSEDTYKLREKLLSVKGIGPETADSILLYAFNKPVFVIDAYTKRILGRHGLIKEDYDYHRVQDLFMSNCKHDARLFNEYHALFVKLAKEYCLKNESKCGLCPLKTK